jgi:hypothetical protein
MTIGRSLKDARFLVGELRDLYNKGIEPKKHNQVNNTDMTLNACLDYYRRNMYKH